MKKVAGKLRIALAQYRELAAFAQFGSDLDAGTQQQLDRGQRMTEVLKQGQYRPLSTPQQVAILYAVFNGFLDAIPVKEIVDYQLALQEYIEARGAAWIEDVRSSGELNEKNEELLKKLLTEFNASRA
jgi:F-type H+-transporting ATPase subunit alpha